MLGQCGVQHNLIPRPRRRFQLVLGSQPRLSVFAEFYPAGTTSTGGYQVAASASVLVPTTGASAEALYGIVASSTANVSFLYCG